MPPPAPPAAAPEKLFHTGERVFVETPEESWVPGTVNTIEDVRNPNTGKTSHKYHCNVIADTTLKIAGIPELPVAESKVHSTVPDESELGAVDDLLLLTYLHESTLLHSVRQRYFRNIIYTRIGPIVLALNPFDYTIPHYQEVEAEKYMEQGASALSGAADKLLPHAWTTAHQAYWLMRSFDKFQSIIVSGESGAGKTETAKIVAKYLGRVSHREAPAGTELSPVPQKVNQSSPILEAFGNAKTKRNDNSSRFGKFMKVHFSKSLGTMIGAEIEVYLLEKSRIVFHTEGERAYHAFYQAVAKDFRSPAHDDPSSPAGGGELRLREAIKTPEIIEGVDDYEEYEAVRQAMDIVGFTGEDQANSWRVCAGVLHALQVQFAPSEDGEGSVVEDALQTRNALKYAADLWGVQVDKLEGELLTTTHVLGGDTVVRMHRVDRARDVRDALCKALYEKLFLELVNIVNISVGAPKHPENWIGLLDIFGFEHFKRNSFEQLCINLANETLQGHYNQIIFTRDMEECKEEGINTESVVFQDNQPCIDLLRGKISLLSLLDEECSLGKGSDISFCANVSQQFKSHPNFVTYKTDPSLFSVKHYAGDVTYSVEGFREKNMDTMKDALKQLIHDSSRSFVGKLLVVEDDAKKKAKTVGAVFRQQLNSLMNVLYATNPHWIRCVKPHPAKKPLMFSGAEVMSQLCCAGVLETVRIRKMSFSVRFTFADFWKHYRSLVNGRLSQSDIKAACSKVLQLLEFGQERAQLGKTKVFLKSDAFQKVSREKEKRQRVAKTHVVAFLHGHDSAKATACRAHMKFVRHIQAFAQLHLSSAVRSAKQTEADNRQAIAWLKSLRECEKQEQEARDEVLAEEKKMLAAAEEGAKDLLVVVYRLMFEKHVKKIADEEEAARSTAIKAEFWKQLAQLEGECLCLAAELEGRRTILQSQSKFHDDAVRTLANLQEEYRAWLLSIFESKVRQICDDESEARTRVELEENSDSTFLFASGRLVLQEKQARRVIFLRSQGDAKALVQRGATERLILQQDMEFSLRHHIIHEEGQMRILMMLESDREEDAVAKMLQNQQKEMYLRKLEEQGAAKKKFLLSSLKKGGGTSPTSLRRR